MESYNPLTRFWGKSSRDAGEGGTGAIDIVAVRSPDGAMQCSPFHVRLPPPVGRKSGGSSNVVKLKVNGNEVKLRMKIGPAGEAFFVQKTDEKVVRAHRTSPPTSSSPHTASSTPPAVADAGDTKRGATEATADESPSSAARRTRSLSANDILEIKSYKHNSTCTGSPSPRTIDATPLSATRKTSPRSALLEPQRARSNSASQPAPAEGPSSSPSTSSFPTPSVWTWVWGDLPKKHKGVHSRSVSALEELTASLEAPSPPLSSRPSPRRDGGCRHTLSQRFSLCGHMLRDERGAPEPAPRTTAELRKMLATYGVPESSVGGLLDDANMVVAVDDYLLSVPMLRAVLAFYREGMEMTKAINSLPIMTAEIINAAAAAAKASRVPSWAGKQISNWSYERLLQGQREHAASPHNDFFFGYSTPLSTGATDGSDNFLAARRGGSPAILVAPGPLQLPDVDSLLQRYSVPVSVPGLELASSPLQQESLLLGSGFYSPPMATDRGKAGPEADILEDIPFDEICPDLAPSDFCDSDTDSLPSYASLGDFGCDAEPRAYRYHKALVPSPEQLLSLGLADGANEILFESDGRALSAQLFVWAHDAKIVVTDIEGVLLQAKPVRRGVWSSFLPTPRALAPPPVVSFFASVERAGYKILYISQSANKASSKEHLAALTESGAPPPPVGPVFQSPERLVRAAAAARADLFKVAALRGVRALFDAHHSPFYASFGQRECDMSAYIRCGIPEGRAYCMMDDGVLHRFRTTFTKTFTDLSADLCEHFPPYADSHARKQRYGAVHTSSSDEAYNDFNFWKIPVQIIN